MIHTNLFFTLNEIVALYIAVHFMTIFYSLNKQTVQPNIYLECLATEIAKIFSQSN